MYRAYWAIPRTMTTSEGRQVNAVFGVASMLLNILKTEEPTHLLFCFDAGEETFRHQENATYKEGRAETPDDFYSQIPLILSLVDAFGIKHVSNPQYEADDLLATYACAARDAGMRATIVSGDRDVLQMASDTIRISIPHKGYQAAEYMGPGEVFAKYGIRPDQVACYKGLIGDTSDNLPGVKGIGPKTASELLQQYDTLENIYAHLADIRPAVRAKLEADREQAAFCKRMAQLVCDIPLPTPLTEVRLESLPTQRILDELRTLEFTLLTRRLRDVLSTEFGRSIFMPVDDISLSSPMTKDERRSEGQLTLF